MDINKLKIKYIINNYKDLPEYPTNEDVLYIICKYCKEKDKSNINNLIIQKESNIEESKLNLILNNLINENYLEIEKIKEDKIFYKIKNNIFI